MNTLQINACLKNCKSFQGTHPLDKIPPMNKSPYSTVINLSPSDHTGSHWVALYSDTISTVEIFDSYGRDLQDQEEFRNVIGHRHVVCNPTPVQSIGSSVCGQYCIFFVYQKERGKSMKQIVQCFSPSRCLENDSNVKSWVHKRFCYRKARNGGKLQICKAMAL